jgi:hypothetical protein
MFMFINIYIRSNNGVADHKQVKRSEHGPSKRKERQTRDNGLRTKWRVNGS